ncbi:unnamed protein product [Arabis nemorensis]|uniref:Uncharacterized protein n=1 Tax=Arabis nemorensis TaxID=586526 RepID=A0A565BCV7_9BRAS|nr:unnamed protein product [Arabis nemorensis]
MARMYGIAAWDRALHDDAVIRVVGKSVTGWVMGNVKCAVVKCYTLLVIFLLHLSDNKGIEVDERPARERIVVVVGDGDRGSPRSADATEMEEFDDGEQSDGDYQKEFLR